MAKIGVEDSLQQVADALREKGHQVVALQNAEDANACDCCVVTGLQSNIMGMQETFTAGAVIEANGLSADEVCQQVESKLR